MEVVVIKNDNSTKVNLTKGSTQQYLDSVTQLALDAKSIATAKALEASNSASSALSSQQSATNSANTATNKATVAAEAANNALSYKDSASVSATIATNKATEASTYASNSASSAILSQDYANKANTFKNTTQGYMTVTEEYKNTTQGYMNSASTSATNAASTLSNFNSKYTSSATAPASPTEGMLWYDTVNNIMKVYDGSGWINAGSSVNGTSSRNTYTATAGRTTFNATYDSGYVDVYRNGLKLSNSDFVATNGTTIVLNNACSLNDVVDIVAYGTFELADAYTKNDSNALLNTKIDKVASTDNAIVRFNGTGQVQNSGVIVDDNNNVGIGITPNSYTNYTTVTQNGYNGVEYDFKIGGNLAGYLELTPTLFKLNAEGNRYIQFVNNGAERMRIDSSGNVGIGTSSPVGKISISGTDSNALVSSNNSISLTNTQGASSNKGSMLKFFNDSRGNNYTAGIGAGLTSSTATGATGYLSFFTKALESDVLPTERMRIGSDGNLLVGVATDNGNKLQVKGSIGLTRDTAFHGEEVGATIKTTASSVGYSDGSDLVFSTMAGDNIDGGTATERMRIDSSGNVGIGTTPSGNSDNTTRRLDIGVGGGLNGSYAGSCTVGLSSNAANNNATSYYKVTGQPSSLFNQYNGVFSWYTAPSGTAGSAITWTQAMTLDASGRLGIGNTAPGYRLDITAGDTTASLGYAMRLRSNTTAGAATLQFTNNGATVENGYIAATDAGMMSFWGKVYINSSGNVGIGVTPSAWSWKALQIGSLCSVSTNNASAVDFNANTFFDGNWKYVTNTYASRYEQYNGTHTWFTAPSGTAGNPITWNTAMTLDNSGSLTVNKISLNNADNHAYISLNGNADRESTIYFNKSGTNKARIGVSSNSNDFIFDVNGAERMRIGANGNLLVGTTTDNGVDKLQVNGGISATTINGVKQLRKVLQPSATGFTTILTMSFPTYVPSSVEVSIQSQRLDVANDTAFNKLYITALRWAGDVFNQRLTNENKTLTSGTAPTYQLVVSGADLLLQVNVQSANQRFVIFCQSIDGAASLS